jgi:hypothetical protein
MYVTPISGSISDFDEKPDINTACHCNDNVFTGFQALPETGKGGPSSKTDDLNQAKLQQQR